MKKITVLIMILIGILAIESCKKEKISSDVETKPQVEINNDVNNRSYQEDECGNISKLCPTCQLLEAVATVELGPKIDGPGMIHGVDNNKITIVIGSEEYIIHPAEYFKDSSTELLIKYQGKEFLYSDTDLKIKKETELVEIPKAVESLKNLDQKAFKAGTLSISSLKGILGQDVTVIDEGDGNYRILVNNNGTTIITSDMIWKDPCQGKSFDNTVEFMYDKVLGRDVPHIQYKDIIHSALNSFLEDYKSQYGVKFDFRSDCVNTQDVVNYILQDPLILGSTHSPYFIKLNYLTALLNLSNEEYDWLYANGTSAHFAEIDKLYNLLGVDSPNGQCADCGRVLAEQAIVALFMDETLTALSNTEIDMIDDFYGTLNCTDSGLYSFLHGQPNSLVKGAFAKVILSGMATLDLINIADKMKLFYSNNRFSPRSIIDDFQFNALEMIASDNSFIYDRFSDLFTFMKFNPNGLLENCVSSNPNLYWAEYYDLLNFTPPQACFNRLFFLNNNYITSKYGVQIFEDANSNLTNLDYYAVEIVTFPKNILVGQ